MKKYALNFQPGERFSYCNAGFVLLGFIVQKVSGISLPDFLHQNLFAPLGMNETGYVNNEKLTVNRASGYNINEAGMLQNGMYISDFYSSLGDMGVMTSLAYFKIKNRASFHSFFVGEAVPPMSASVQQKPNSLQCCGCLPGCKPWARTRNNDGVWLHVDRKFFPGTPEKA